MKRSLLVFVAWFLGTLLVALLLVMLGIVYRGGASWSEAWGYVPRMLRALGSNWLLWIILSLPYLLSRIVKRIIRGYREHQWRGALRAASWALLLPLALLLSSYVGLKAYYANREDFTYPWDASVLNETGQVQTHPDEKQRGIHIFLRHEDVAAELDSLVALNVEWVTLVPYAYQEDADQPELRGAWNIQGRRRHGDSTYRAWTTLAHDRGLKVHLKPHIWMEGGAWRNAIAMETDADWDAWFAEYTACMLYYAQLAQSAGMDMLCVGTELHQTAVQQPDRWRALISQIRATYDGPLTYAANWWEEYQEVAFWDALDFIGVQGYFPLEHGEEITVAELVQSWQPHITQLAQLSAQWKKPILFTEVGYKSAPNAAQKPWEWEEYTGFSHVSYKTQTYCYEALFEALWHQPWFAGVHFWKWEGGDPADFTPKGKPAAQVMAEWFGK